MHRNFNFGTERSYFFFLFIFFFSPLHPLSDKLAPSQVSLLLLFLLQFNLEIEVGGGGGGLLSSEGKKKTEQLGIAAPRN